MPLPPRSSRVSFGRWSRRFGGPQGPCASTALSLPQSTGWGQAKVNEQAATKFLRNLAAGKPEQTHVIKFKADKYGA